jgi:SAM-dependent methyltransferase
MHNFLSTLNRSQIVLDLGCGRGSFHYELYECGIVAIDINIDPSDKRAGVSYIRSDSKHIPLADGSVDAVVCHHTFEHFENYEQVLREIARILKDRAMLWIAVPNGQSFDDALYRLVFEGGGHVNRFTRTGLIADVENMTRLRLIECVDLFSGFIYLKRPTEEQYRGFPRSARFLMHIPLEVNTAGVLTLNAATRIIDKVVGSRTSQYGWGFLFGTEGTRLKPLAGPCFNVCSNCGSPNAAAELKVRGLVKSVLGLGFYKCMFCDQLNSFVKPPRSVA